MCLKLLGVLFKRERILTYISVRLVTSRLRAASGRQGVPSVHKRDKRSLRGCWLDFSQTVTEEVADKFKTTFITGAMSPTPSALSAQKRWLSDAVAELLASDAEAEAEAERSYREALIKSPGVSLCWCVCVPSGSAYRVWPRVWWPRSTIKSTHV